MIYVTKEEFRKELEDAKWYREALEKGLNRHDEKLKNLEKIVRELNEATVEFLHRILQPAEISTDLYNRLLDTMQKAERARRNRCG